MKAEPNLTPLLDVVLQLVMFFILVANFTMREVNEDVQLPFSSLAGPGGSRGCDVLYLNFDGKGRLVPADGNDPRVTPAEIQTYLHHEYRRCQELAKVNNEKEPNTVVILRAHRDSDFASVFTALRAAKQAGFTKCQLRALILRQS